MILGIDLEQVRVYLLGAAAALQTAFVLLYLTFPWYSTFLGRALFGKALVLAVILDAFIIARLFGMSNVDLLFTVLYGGLVLGIGAQLVAFFKVKTEGRADEVSGNAPTHEERRW